MAATGIGALVEVLRWQADGAIDLGSPFLGSLAAAAADDAAAGGPIATICEPLIPPDADVAWLRDEATALRLFGSVHRLVLAGALPELAAHYPTTGGTGDASAAWPAFRAALVTQTDAVRAGMARPPQTNETGRAALLLAGLATVAGGSPVRLLEIGTSGGLNLRADHFRLDVGDGAVIGPLDSPVHLAPEWRGGRRPPVADVTFVERRGCDPDPLDPTDDEDALTLRAYVWPDQTARHDRLRGALTLAREIDAEVVATTAGPFLRDLVPEPGVVTAVWHSVVRQYVPTDEWAEAMASLEVAGRAATSDARVVHLAFEPSRQWDGSLGFELRVQVWPGSGEERRLAVAHPHATWIEWQPENDGGAQ